MDKEVLFKSYIDVCNQALDKNKDRFPYDRILCNAENTDSLSPVKVKIIDDAAQPQFHLTLKDGKIIYELSYCQSVCRHCAGGCGKKNNVWTVSTSYLEDVIKHPQNYIDNPATLDWEWVAQSDIYL